MKSLTSYVINEGSKSRIDKIWGALVDWNVATEEELKLVTNINGYSEESLNDVIYARTGMHDIEQLAEEEGYDLED